MHHYKCVLLAWFLLVFGSSIAIAACPPGTRSEGGTGGKDGEEICFGTPTNQVNTAPKKRKKVKKAKAVKRKKRLRKTRPSAPNTTASGCPPGTRNEGGTGGKGGEMICF